MRLIGIVAAKRELRDHTHSPRIATEEPIAERSLHFLELAVARELTIENALREHGSGKVVGAPNTRDAPHERMVAPALQSALNASAQIAHKFGTHLRILSGHGSQLIVTHVEERVPLVVACAVGTHPRSDRLTTAIFHRLVEIAAIACEAEHLHCAELHIVGPVVFFIYIGRHHRGRLRVARLVDSNLIGIGSLCANAGGKLWIERLEHLRAKGEIAGKLAGGACRAHGGIHKLATLLRLAADKIDRSAVARAIAVVGRIVVGQLLPYVVTVVGNLIIQLALFGIHAVEPVEAPIYFIHDVGDAVASG